MSAITFNCETHI